MPAPARAPHRAVRRRGSTTASTTVHSTVIAPWAASPAANRARGGASSGTTSVPAARTESNGLRSVISACAVEGIPLSTPAATTARTTGRAIEAMAEAQRTLRPRSDPLGFWRARQGPRRGREIGDAMADRMWFKGRAAVALDAWYGSATESNLRDAQAWLSDPDLSFADMTGRLNLNF